MGKHKIRNNVLVYKDDASAESIDASAGNKIEEPHYLPCLSEAFEENVRPFIDLIDKLRLLGLDKDIALPEVAVIGDQSAGKSSVLEAISGVQLPRGSGIVTRCPLALQLKSHSTPGYWNGVIEYEMDGHTVENVLGNSTEVDQEVREAQDAIAGKDVGISDSLISLQITAQGIPDLTLIDLPGITRVAVEGQPEDIADQIKRLIRKYIEKEETIILAVVPANVDIATTEALQMAKEVDPSGSRTLGVVTKPDLIDAGTEKGLLDIINNKSYPLDKGYSCVKCRGQKAIDDGQTLAQAIQKDDDFFKSKDYFSDVDDTILGVNNLAMKLTYELVKQIKRALPEMREKIQKKLIVTKHAVADMTQGVPEDIGQRNVYLLQLLQRYTDGVKEVVNGEHKGRDGNKLIPECRTLYEQLATQIRSRKPVKTERYLQQIMDISSGQRGRELPRFLIYATCEFLIVEIVDEYNELFMATLEKISELVGTTFRKLATNTFGNFPQLDRKIKCLVDRLQVEANSSCQENLHRLLKMEKRSFTQDDIYTTTLDDILEKEQKQKMSKKQEEQFNGLAFPNATTDHLKTNTPLEDAEAMFHMLNAYMKVCNRRLVDYAPMTMMYDMVDELSAKIRDEVIALAADSDTLEALKENQEVAHKRDQLSRKLTRLQQASTELAMFQQ